MLFDCVLGKDFLCEAGLVLTKSGNCAESENVSEDYFTEDEKFERAIMSIECEDACTMDLWIGEVL